MRKINITKEILYQKYIVEQLHPKQIAIELSMGEPTVYKYLRLFEIPKRHINVHNLVNLRAGRLLVTEFSHVANKTSYWICQCDCGKVVCVEHSHLMINSDTKKPRKQSCGCLQIEVSYNNHYNSYKHVHGLWFNQLKQASKRRKIEWNIMPKDIHDLLIKQDWKCAISGIILSVPLDFKHYKSRKWNASVDRIDSSKGYVIDNIQIVDKRINMMKQQYSQEEFIKLCKTVAEYQSC